jgi:hypothetical protein
MSRHTPEDQALDLDIEHRFTTLDTVPPPELWGRIAEESSRPPTDARWTDLLDDPGDAPPDAQRVLFAAACALLFLVGIGTVIVAVNSRTEPLDVEMGPLASTPPTTAPLVTDPAPPTTIATPSTTPTTPETAPVADPDCPALRGAEPWLTLFEAEHATGCVAVADRQDLQIWNKGTTPQLQIDWVDGQRTLGSDSFFSTGPIGAVLDYGDHTFDATPYAMPTIRVVDPADSLTGELQPTLGEERFSIGGVRVGMSLEAAGVLLGAPVEIDLNVGPSGTQAFVVGDPYSPRFTVAGDPPVITGINVETGPLAAGTTGTSLCISSDGDCSVLAGLGYARELVSGELSSLPLHPDATISVASGGSPDVSQPLTDGSDRSQWVVQATDYAGYDGPFDVLGTLSGLEDTDPADAYTLDSGPHDHCASPPLDAPQSVAEIEAIQWSIQPVGTTTCLQWFAVDLFVDSNELIRAVRLEVWEP